MDHLVRLIHSNFSRICHYWLHVTLQDCQVEQLEHVLVTIMTRSICLELDSHHFYLFSDAPWSRFPLRMFSKSQCSILQHLVSSSVENNTFRLCVDCSYTIRYKRFLYNSYVEGRFRRIALIKSFLSELFLLFPPVDSSSELSNAHICCCNIVLNLVQTLCVKNLFATHPLRCNLLKYVANKIK